MSQNVISSFRREIPWGFLSPPTSRVEMTNPSKQQGNNKREIIRQKKPSKIQRFIIRINRLKINRSRIKCGMTILSVLFTTTHNVSYTTYLKTIFNLQLSIYNDGGNLNRLADFRAANRPTGRFSPYWGLANQAESPQ